MEDEFEYWNEKAVYESFLNSSKNERIELGGGIVRRNGTVWVLVKPFEDWSKVEDLKLLARDASKLRSVQFSSKTIPDNVPKVLGDWTYYAPKSWLPPKDVAYCMRRGVREGLHTSDATEEEYLEMLYGWKDWAKTRLSKIIVTGHYREMIKDANFKKIAWRNNDGTLLGVCGFLKVDAGACITLIKHVSGLNWLSGAIWGTSITELQKRYGVVYCGDTADRFKNRTLKLPKFKLARVDFANIGTEHTDDQA